MSKLNLLVVLNSYSDHKSTNSPDHNGVRWTREIDAIPVLDAGHTNTFVLAPGETKVLFDTTRTLAQDNTTQYSLSLLAGSSNVYVLSAVGGTLPNFRAPRVTGADATTQVTITVNGPVATFSAPAVAAAAAFFTGTVAGISTSVTITANTVGAAGNSVLLVGDGSSSINALITAWNTANPSNMISLSSGDGTQIPNMGAAIALSGGANSATAFNLISGGAVVGDKVRIGNAFNILNQGEWKIISLTATSFSVANPLAAAQGPVLLGSSFASQVQIYSAAGVQINDTLVLDSGFSQVSWGSYYITSVSANSLQFYSTAILPQEGPITTEVHIYENAKKFVYLEADQLCNVSINGSAAGSVQPWIVYNTTKPGQYMMTATVYSMSVTNASTNGANLMSASVE